MAKESRRGFPDPALQTSERSWKDLGQDVLSTDEETVIRGPRHSRRYTHPSPPPWQHRSSGYTSRRSRGSIRCWGLACSFLALRAHTKPVHRGCRATTRTSARVTAGKRV